MKNLLFILLMFIGLFPSCTTTEDVNPEPSPKTEEKLAVNQYFEYEFEITYLVNRVNKTATQIFKVNGTSWYVKYSSTTTAYDGQVFKRHIFATLNTSKCVINNYTEQMFDDNILSVKLLSKKVMSCR